MRQPNMPRGHGTKRTSAARVTWFVISELLTTVKIAGVAIVETPTRVPTICVPRGAARANPYPISPYL